MAAFAVHVFRVAVDAVAALHLGDGGGRVGGGAQGVRVVQAAAELDVILVPVPPQDCLDLSRETTHPIKIKFMFLFVFLLLRFEKELHFMHLRYLILSEAHSDDMF